MLERSWLYVFLRAYVSVCRFAGIAPDDDGDDYGDSGGACDFEGGDVHMPPASPSAAPAMAADGWRQLDAHALAAAAQPFAKGATWSKPKQRMARARKADVRRLDPAVVVGFAFSGA